MAFGMKTQLIGFVEETTSGTYNSAVETARPNVRIETGATVDTAVELDGETDFLSGDWGGNDISVPGARTAKVTPPTKMSAGEFVAGTPAKHKLTYAPLLKASGLASVGKSVETTDNVAGTRFFFPSRLYAGKTLSFARWLANNSGTSTKVHRDCISGAVANFSIDVAGRGKPFMLNTEFSGVVESVGDIDLSEMPLFDDANALAIIPDAFLETTITLKNIVDSETTSHCVAKLNFNNNAVVSEIECQSHPSGIQSYYVSDIAPSLSIDPLLRTKDQFDTWTSLIESTLYEVTIASPHIELYIPRAQILEAPIVDSNGIARTAIKFKPLRNIYKDLPVGLLEANMTGYTIEEAMYFIAIKEKASDY